MYRRSSSPRRRLSIRRSASLTSSFCLATLAPSFLATLLLATLLCVTFLSVPKLDAQESPGVLKEPVDKTAVVGTAAETNEAEGNEAEGDEAENSAADSRGVENSEAESGAPVNRDMPANAATFAEVLQIARDGVKHIDHGIRDYSCLLVKRERVEGILGDYQYMVAKVRHRNDGAPFSLYLRFLKPDDVQDREVLFVAGANDGKIVAKKGGFRFSHLTTEIKPDSEMAMQGNRYPITEFGVQNLAHKLLAIAEDKDIAQEFDVELRHHSKVDDRECLSIIVTKRERTSDDQFYLAKVFIDKELMVPIHFESYDWPGQGKTPRLLEQYTYRNLKLNVGFTTRDFDRNHPSYGFRKKR